MQYNTDDTVAVEERGRARDRIKGEPRKAIVGMDDVIDRKLYVKKAR